MVARSKHPPQEVRIKDIGGLPALAVTLQPGINVLRGPNGSGKTSAIGAITKAYGGKVAIEKRDGAAKGTVEVPGTTVSMKMVARATGEAEVALANVGPFSEFIDPGIDDPERAEFSRMRSLLEIYPMPVDEAKLVELAGHDDVAREVVGELREGGISDLLTAAERCRLVGHKLAREAESKVSQLEGAAGGAQQRLEAALEKVGGEEGLVEQTASQAETEGHAAAERLAVARQARAARLDLERRQGEIRATMGAAPDPARFDRDIEIRQAAVAAHQARVDELTAQLARERETMAGVVADLEGLRRARAEEHSQAMRHAANLAVLNEPATGPTEEEVEGLEQALARSKDLFRVARLSDEVRGVRAELEVAREAVKEAKRRAAALRDAATSIGWRIGEQLEKLGIEGLTISEGRFAVREADGTVHDFGRRRSEGQQVVAAFRIFAPAYAGRVMPLAGHLWQSLDNDHRAEIASLAAAIPVYLLTEAPADGELRLEHEVAA